MIDGKPAKGALQLVAIDDQVELVRRRRRPRQQAQVRRPLSSPATLGVAGAHEDPVRPGVKARRVAELADVPPDAQQRLLRRILGEIGVTQDPVCHRMEPIAHGDSEAREGLLIAMLHSNHEFGIHHPSPSAPRISGRSLAYEPRPVRNDSIFAATRCGVTRTDPRVAWLRLLPSRLPGSESHEVRIEHGSRRRDHRWRRHRQCDRLLPPTRSVVRRERRRHRA